MSASLRPTEIHRRRQRRQKRQKLKAKIAAAPAAERGVFEAKLQRSYALVPGGAEPTK
jgi:hypothetical protein